MKKEKRSRVSGTKFEDLPQELIVEILSRLPVQSLLQCKSIRKSWKSLISDSKFMLCNSHGQREKLLLFLRSRQGIIFRSLADSYCSINHQQICAQECINPFPGYFYLGSCNGLLFLGNSQNIRLWNPSTQYNKVVHHRYNLGQLCYVILASGVVYDESVDDYKIVIVTHDHWKPGTMLVLVSYLKSTSWARLIISLHLKIRKKDFATPVVNGNLHFVAEDEEKNHLIISFDTKRDRFESVSKPDTKLGGQDFIYGLGVIEERLTMVRPDRYCRDVLVMKEYGKKESWTVMFSLPDSKIKEIGYSLLPVFLSKDGKFILVENHEKVLAYDWEKKSQFADDVELPSSIQNLLSSSSMFGFTCVESLADGNQARPPRKKKNNKLCDFVYF